MGKRTNTAAWLENQKRWQINVQKDGVRRTFTSSKPGRTGQREANAKADAWLDDGIDSKGIKVSAAYDNYLKRLEDTTSRSHHDQYESFGRVWIKPVIGHKKVESVTEDDLQRIIDKAYKAGRAEKTIRDIRTAIASFFKYCRRNKLTTLLPESLAIPRGAKKSQKSILQPHDIAKLFSSDKTLYRNKETAEPLIHAFRFQVLTGLRPGELLGLEWKDIKGRNVWLKGSYNRYGKMTTGKTDNAVRAFTMTESARAEIEEQCKINPFGRVFGNISQGSYKNAWKRYCKHNGLTPVTPYELRHTFISIAKQLPEGQVKALVGHSRNMDTFGVYGHELAGERAQTADALQGIFNDILSVSGQVG